MSAGPCRKEGCEETKLKARGLCAPHYTPAKKYPPQALSKLDVKHLLDAADGPAWTNKRDRALMVLLAHSGLRIDEALSLKPSDLDWDREPRVTVFVAHGKGDRSRTVVLGTLGQDDVKAWLSLRAELFGPTTGTPLFPSASGRKLDASQVRRLFRRLGVKAGISKRVHPHALRHAFAVDMARAGKRPDLIQRQLGHSNLGTTTKYLSTVAPEEVIEEMYDL